MPPSVHAFKAFCSLPISALMIDISLGESMTSPFFWPLRCHHCDGIIPYRSTGQTVGRQVNCADMVSKTEQHSPSSSRILIADSPRGGPMLGYGLLGTVVVIAVIVLIVRAL
jgi:hypothetical protein